MVCPNCGRNFKTLKEGFPTNWPAGLCICGFDFLAEKRLALDPLNGQAFSNIPGVEQSDPAEPITVEDLESFLAGNGENETWDTLEGKPVKLVPDPRQIYIPGSGGKNDRA
jgi:hypothetical protein